jgi:lipopolysaccharide transport system ATP-binding protein
LITRLRRTLLQIFLSVNAPIIIAEKLGKKYRLNHQADRPRYTALRDVMTEGFARLFREGSRTSGYARGQIPTPPEEDFWALRDVSFEINRGDVVGIIGRNGAGKSTLLKILSRITEPTCGRVRIRGHVASLLEVGTGFHPELTGRENIFLNGAILGMRRADIKSRFDEIVAFADVERFLDTPVKRYSSGMYVRLAFAVAAHLEPEILVVDEVLAVGDAQFQKKCLGKMESVSRESGRTIFFVSHNMAAVRTLCSRAILFHKGRVLGEGATNELINSYLRAEEESVTSSWERPPGMLRVPPLYITKVEAGLIGRQPKLQMTIDALFTRVGQHCSPAFVAVDLRDSLGVALMQAEPSAEPFLKLEEGTYRLKISIDLPPLIPGRYTADLWIGSHYTTTIDYVKNVVAVSIEESPTVGRTYQHYADHGQIVPPSRCSYEKLEPSDVKYNDIFA